MVSKWGSWAKKNANLIIVLLVVFGFSAGTLALATNTANKQASTDAKVRQSEQKAGLAEEQKLCTTFGRLAALSPPPGNPATNPSRAYLQEQHDVLVQLGHDIGCKIDPPVVSVRQEEKATAKEYRHGYNRSANSNPYSAEPWRHRYSSVLSPG